MSGVQYKDAAGQMRISKAHLTVCCDGMYSTFRKKLVAKPSIHHPSFFVALLLRDVTLPFPNHGHVVLCQPSPVLFYPISSKEVRHHHHNCCCCCCGGGCRHPVTGGWSCTLHAAGSHVWACTCLRAQQLFSSGVCGVLHPPRLAAAVQAYCTVKASPAHSRTHCCPPPPLPLHRRTLPVGALPGGCAW